MTGPLKAPLWDETRRHVDLSRGRILPRALSARRSRDYFLYLPACPVTRILVSVHGTSRNALEHVLYLTDVAERRSAVVVAPIFRRKLHRGYQRLQDRARGERADVLLDGILAAVRREVGLEEAPFSLFGFSGGAQFAHRYALANPRNVETLILASAGWYTMPDPTLPYPLGTLASKRYPHLALNLEEFLKLPIHVAVGLRDTEQDIALNDSPDVAALQGENRLERARNWVQCLRAFAAANHHIPRVELTEMPKVGHSFAQAVHQGHLDVIVDRAMQRASS